METKKNSKVNLEKFRVMFFLSGLIFALAIVFATFNQSKADVNISILDKNIDVVVDEELVMITKPKPITPPPPKTHIDMSIIEVAANDVDLKDFLFDIPLIEDPVIFTDPFDDPTNVPIIETVFDYVNLCQSFRVANLLCWLTLPIK